jgi:predicted nucleic acid-binding protein
LKEVLDTRFFIELFYSKKVEYKKKAKDRIVKLAKDRQGIVPSIVLTELTRIICDRHGKEEAKIAYLSLLESGLDIVPLSPELAGEAGLIGCRYKKVPMGDCIIAATAIQAKAVVITDDPHFNEIKEVSHTWL